MHRGLLNWNKTEVVVLGADQNDRGYWGRECVTIESKSVLEDVMS